eukprot:CAMPEP_0180314674 /NCGR_PEP_ID=MMETSP0988-20121125/32193_1 /TAXON_ID=697907 /ORGANISM="non described non described, Strain CCMP2293" /LENGTH=58 /DNA_ID=CAMNT_0022299405 /DNA_START=74 /DNA_END=246 /DNA_ORIENTATION=-
MTISGLDAASTPFTSSGFVTSSFTSPPLTRDSAVPVTSWPAALKTEQIERPSSPEAPT